MFLKVPVIIIIFGENYVFGTIYIDMYQFRGWARGLTYIYRLLFIKNIKITRTWLIIK